jgi:hypothetical protein
MAGRGARGEKTGVYTIVNEDFRAPSNKVMPSAVVLHQPVNKKGGEAPPLMFDAKINS